MTLDSQKFLIYDTKNIGNNSKNRKLDYIKIKNCASKEQQLTEWEKIFANQVSDKGLTSRIKNSYDLTKNPLIN